MTYYSTKKTSINHKRPAQPAYKALVPNQLSNGITVALARLQARERIQREEAARVEVGPNNPSVKE